jgi:GR25 family glycosyltransferase involved in LPS biosynthesis
MSIDECVLPSKRLEKFDPEKWEVDEATNCVSESRCSRNFEVRMPVYVINCKMHTDRMTKFDKYAQKAGLTYCRIPCVLGKKFKKDEICKMKDAGLLAKNAELTQVEISINMSHYNCWQKLLNSCAEYGLIFEDDAEVHADFIDRVNEIMRMLKQHKLDDFSILHLYNGNWGRSISKHKKMLAINDKIKIVQETVSYNAAASAYIISAKYAKYLIDHSFPIQMAQDILMGLYVNVGKHLSLKMKHNKNKNCYVSPLLGLPCGGERGTGPSTQTYDAPTTNTYYCAPCKRSPKRSSRKRSSRKRSHKK